MKRHAAGRRGAGAIWGLRITAGLTAATLTAATRRLRLVDAEGDDGLRHLGGGAGRADRARPGRVPGRRQRAAAGPDHGLRGNDGDVGTAVRGHSGPAFPGRGVRQRRDRRHPGASFAAHHRRDGQPDERAHRRAPPRPDRRARLVHGRHDRPGAGGRPSGPGTAAGAVRHVPRRRHDDSLAGEDQRPHQRQRPLGAVPGRSADGGRCVLGRGPELRRTRGGAGRRDRGPGRRRALVVPRHRRRRAEDVAHHGAYAGRRRRRGPTRRRVQLAGHRQADSRGEADQLPRRRARVPVPGGNAVRGHGRVVPVAAGPAGQHRRDPRAIPGRGGGAHRGRPDVGIPAQGAIRATRLVGGRPRSVPQPDRG